MTQLEWIGLAIILLSISVVVLAVSLYFVRQQIKRINKFQFLIRDDVAEDVKKLKERINWSSL